MEIFKEIDESANHEVSNLGRVRNKNGRVLKGCICKRGYYRVSLNHTKTHYVHRLIALYFIPNPDNLSDVDHIDGDKQNNKIENLRWTTHQQNSCNLKISSNNTSGFTGVSFRKDRNKWQAYIEVNTIKISLGRFATAELANEARQKYIADNNLNYFRTTPVPI